MILIKNIHTLWGRKYPDQEYIYLMGSETCDQEYIYFMGYETFPSACYILSDESSISFCLLHTFRKLVYPFTLRVTGIIRLLRLVRL